MYDQKKCFHILNFQSVLQHISCRNHPLDFHYENYNCNNVPIFLLFISTICKTGNNFNITLRLPEFMPFKPRRG